MLSGESTNLRAIERSDLERNLRWVNDREVTEHLLLRYPMSEEQERAWIEGATGTPPSYAEGVPFAIEIAGGDHAGTHIGNCGFEPVHPLDRSAELGVMLGAKEHWGRGYGFDALRTLITFGFRQLNFRRIWLRVDSDHPRAIALYERLGFRGEGILQVADWRRGRAVDVLVMALLREEFDVRYSAFEEVEAANVVPDPLDRARYILGGRVRLRPYRFEDAVPFQAWVNDPEIQRLIGGHGWQFSLPAEEEFIRAHLENDWEHGFAFAIEATDAGAPQLIGSMELRKLQAIERRGEIGILIGDRACWSRGYGEDAMRTICGFGFRDLDLHRLELTVAGFNARAIRCYEKVGFSIEGRLRDHRYVAGRYYDTLVMGLLRYDFEAREATRA